MFRNCASFVIGNLSTSNVTSFTIMFYFCSAVTNLNLTSFVTSNVTSINYTFCFCTKLTMLNMAAWNMAKLQVVA